MWRPMMRQRPGEAPLLKLRKVELIGFKSFCERTAITFSGNGTTCIVGPNGCGKSNVVDAVSWVLGEQSHKSLRAERMADCIFNGTAKRPPMGLSEVMITLEDPQLADAARFILESAAKAEENRAEEAALGEGETAVEPAPEELATEGTEGAESAESSSGLKPGRRKRTADKPQVQAKPGEVVVGRRLYRSGQSEYLINGRVARLRDIQDLFMGMGLGPDSYAIIEQGRIGQILSTKPMERRAIIEEAAGVTKFKSKKRLSEAKLESSKINLSRVNDIVVEVEKQLGSLKRQASKARRYAEIREQMRGMIRQVLASKARELDTEAERLAHLLGDLAARETQQAGAIRTQELEQDQLSQKTYSLDAELRQNQNFFAQAALELDRAENRIVFNQHRALELESRLKQLEAEREQTLQHAAQASHRRAAQQQAAGALSGQSRELQALLQEASEKAQDLSLRAQQTESSMEDQRRKAGQFAEDLMHLHGEQLQAEEALAHYGEAQVRLKAEEHVLLEESLQLRDRADAAANEWQAAADRTRALEEQIREVQRRITGFRLSQEEAAADAEAARTALTGARARRGTLEQILNDHSYTAEAVQKLFAANEDSSRGFRAVGVLADYAEVEVQYEGAVEQFLRDELEYVVVETFDHARTGVALLRDEMGGRATFFVDSLRTLNFQAEEPAVPFRADRGVLSRLDKLVEFRDPLGAAAKQFLPRLRSAFLVDSAAAAERLSRENPQYHFVTPEGTSYQGRMVTGGRPDQAGPLGMRRELRGLDAEILQLERRVEQARGALERIAGELRASEQALEETIALHREAEKAVLLGAHHREQAHAELARLGVDLSACQQELERLRVEMQAAEQRAALAQRNHAAALDSRAAAEAGSVRAAEELAVLREQLQAQQEESGRLRAGHAALLERLASAESLAARLAEEQHEIERRESSLNEQLASLQAERSAVESLTADLQQQLESLRGEKSRLEARRVELEREWDDSRNRTAHVDDALRRARQSLEDLRGERSQHEVERARNDSDRNHLRETCLAELNAYPEDLIAQEHALLSGEELAAAETGFREMKARIEAMGPVNMMALEEYNECEQRFGFLTRERDDLLQSIADTQQAIRELDEVSRRKFEEAFTVINANFAVAFRTLFGGGTGEMRLTEPDSSGDAGIDVVAQPPGKRLQNVLLLSGGEKAMTALALLIAIFRFQPSPFCILDEVDAPLDEANVGRFTRLLAEMSTHTQFIVVTHNRRTMETASVLYGVTMQEPGVSKLVSVRWEENAKSAVSAA
jgi:chromosome segregation protein